MGLPNKLSYEAGSFSHCLNPHGFFQSEVLRLYFPTLESWIVWSVSLPSCSSQFIHMQMWDRPLCQLLPCPPLVLQPPPCCESSPPQLPVSAPPTSLDDCFFFNSLVVRLPFSSIFWQFWLFFVFKYVVVFLLVVQGGKVYLPTPPSWLYCTPMFVAAQFTIAKCWKQPKCPSANEWIKKLWYIYTVEF